MASEKHDYHEVNISLARPDLFGGVEPIVMALAVFLGTFGIFVASMSAYKYGVALIMSGIAVNIAGRFLAKEDPCLCMIYLRSLKYRKFYAPRPSPWRVYSGALDGIVLRVLFIAAGICVAMLVIALGYPFVVGM